MKVAGYTVRLREPEKLYWFILLHNGPELFKVPYYRVKEMCQEDFYDFKVVESKLVNTTIDKDQQKVPWLKIRKYVTEKDNPNMVNIYYELNGGPIHMNLAQKIRRRTSKLSANSCSTCMRMLNLYHFPMRGTKT